MEVSNEYRSANADSARIAVLLNGGKFNLAPWIVGHFPTHLTYLEPFFGAGSTLFFKPPCTIETVNDLDGRVVNFFRVLRNDADELIRHIKLTPWAREEYLLSLQQSDDPFEDARLFFMMCWMSMNGSTGTSPGSWRHRCDDQCQSPAVETLRVDHLYIIAERLRLVQIECRDALEVIPVYDRPEGLIYADPPYVLSTRGGRYKFDVTDEFQTKLAALLRECQSYVVVSGYPSEMYDKLYEGWTRVDKEDVQVNAGEKRTECLWLSPRTVDALSIPKQASLF